MGGWGHASARANRAIFLPLVLAFVTDAWALVSIPYTRERFPVQCQPGNCFYVDAVNGSDASDGTTRGTAWKTLQRGASGAPGGATVLVADGLYTSTTGASNVLFINKPGTPEKWTTFAALPGHRPIVQVPRGAYYGIGVPPGAHHVLVDGFEIVGPAQSMTLEEAAQNNDGSTRLYNEQCVAIGGGNLPQPYDIIIRNSVLHDCPGGAIIHFAADSVFILSNHIYNNGWYTVFGGAGINVVHQADAVGSTDVGGYRSYIVGNLLERNWNYLSWKGASPPLVGKICDGDGIIIDANKHTQAGVGPGDVTGVPYTGRTYVANNIVRDSGAQGINAFISAHVDFVNNTTYNSLLTETCNIHGEISVTDSADINVINNVAINLNGKSAVASNSGFFDYNVWDGGSPNATQLGPHGIRGDAHLTAPAQGDFTPSRTSPALDSGSSVLAPAVDFFGNPRPPSQVDRGAIQVSGTGPDLNQHGLTGSWFEEASSGQGVEVEVFPNPSSGTGLAFVSWFTYDTVIGGAERQRWYTALGQVVTGQPNASLTIYQNTGGNFNAPPVTNAQAIGTATLSFSTCTSGQLSYTFTDGTGRTGTIPLTRLTQNVTCSTTTPYPTNADFALSGNWFGGAATSGQGFTAEVNPNSGAFFLAWYTYMPNGVAAGAGGQRWYTALGNFTPGLRSIPVTVYETTGGMFDAPTPAGQKTVAVGTGTMAFQSCSAATFNYNFIGGTSIGLSGTINLIRVGPVPPGCTS